MIVGELAGALGENQIARRHVDGVGIGRMDRDVGDLTGGQRCGGQVRRGPGPLLSLKRNTLPFCIPT